MTHSIDRSPERLIALSIVPPVSQPDLVPLVALKANYDESKWELSIAGKFIGRVEKSPSWLFDEVFEGNPYDVFECHPYGVCATRAEAIGRLFAGWLVDQKIADPHIFQAEPSYTGIDYM
jgi:hypothetical protein